MEVETSISAFVFGDAFAVEGTQPSPLRLSVRAFST
jgi:hypothetical protein